jgi:hypothetical protein
MGGHAGLIVRGLILLALVALLAGHALMLRFVATHLALPVFAVGALLVIVVAYHLGLIGALAARIAPLLRRLSRKGPHDVHS